MDNAAASPLDTLRQLKEMLDAGALTPAEFEALKQRLVLSPAAAVPPVAPPVAPAAPAPPVAAPELPATAAEQYWPTAEDVAAAKMPPPASVDTPQLEARPPVMPVASAPEVLANAPHAGWAANEFADAEAPPARNPLSLVLSIGGLLALLGLVLYLSLNRPPSEHISSTSQTAADTLATDIETGPQAEQLAPPPTAPETVRVAPVHPAAPLPARPTPPADSATTEAPASGDTATSH